MKVYYDEGPPVIRFGPHEMRIGEPAALPEKVMEDLLRKGRVKKWEEKSAERPEHGAKRKGN